MSGEISVKGEARVAGIASGTGFVGLLNLLPPGYHWLREGLVYLAPALSVLVTFLWGYTRIQLSRWATGRELDKAIAKATIYRDQINADPLASQAFKANAQQAVDDLTHLRFEALREHYRRIQAHLT